MKVIPLPGRIAARPSFWSLLYKKRRWFWGIGLTLLLTLLLGSRVVPDRVSLQPGQVSDEDIHARRSVTYISESATSDLRDEAASHVPRQYDDDPDAASEAVRSLDNVFSVFAAVKSSGQSGDKKARLAAAQKALPVNVRISPEALNTALAASDATITDLRKRAEMIVGQVMDADIRSDNGQLDDARKQIDSLAKGLHLPVDATQLVAETAQTAIRPNRILSVHRTEAARLAARRAVAPVTRTILRDELIIGKGELVTDIEAEKFKALGLQHTGLDFARLAGLFLFLGTVVFTVSFFLRLYHPDVYHDLRKVALLSILVGASVAGLKIGYSFLGVQLSPSQLGYLTTLWIAVPAMLAATLVNADAALLIAALLSVTAGVAWEIEPRYLALSLVGSLAGMYGVSRIRDRSDLMRIAAILAGTNVALVWILGWLNGDLQSEMIMGTWWVLGTGLASALLFWIGVAAFERPFGLVTHIGLLELADLNRDLLRRLQWEAPGTFHHSLGVAVLAEAAAEAIGADALLARVCAYYHDIGKMRRPQYFAENQQVENIHDKLAPTLSTLAITAHVKEGLEIAHQHRLPPAVSDAIVQHHGTSLVSYFYHQATEGVEPDEALEQQFRYEGPKPQGKEMAILMLADTAEALSRTLEKPTPQKLEHAIAGIIEARLRDGQLDECNLTFRDIGLIKSAFVRVLVSMLHTRIEYPNVIVSEHHRNNHGHLSPKDAPGTGTAQAAESTGRGASTG